MEFGVRLNPLVSINDGEIFYLLLSEIYLFCRLPAMDGVPPIISEHNFSLHFLKLADNICLNWSFIELLN